VPRKELLCMGRDLYLHHRVQTVSGAHKDSCSMGIRGSFPESKAPFSADVKNT